MKILRIEGEGLASLKERFEVDFEAPPLGGAGLLAITGPTGAGKSTLLDALCLALFDRTPRLGDRSVGVLVGRDEHDPNRLSATDVKNVLSRGAATGWAVVDFRGKDGHTYRAKWEVRRARDRATGKVQEQTLSLHNLATGAPLGGKKRETLEEIEGRLGLSFDQFRRSALLAQGDFAAFLKAPAGERAELLEQMTGTAIYGEISKKAHERARDEGAKLALLEEKLRARQPLPEVDRQALVERLAGLDLEALRLEARQQAARASLEWERARQALAQAHGEVAAQHERARARWEAEAPGRAELEQALRCEPLRAPLVSWRQAQADHQHASGALERLAPQLDQISRQLAGAEARRQEATAAAEAAQRRRAEAAPELDRAAALDAQLAAAAEAAGAARAQLHQRQSELSKERAAQAGRQEHKQRAAATLEGHHQWQSAHPELGALAQQRGRLETHLGQAEALCRDLGELAGALTRHERQLEQARPALTLAQQEDSRAQQQLEEATASAQGAQDQETHARAAFDPDREEALRQRERGLVELERLEIPTRQAELEQARAALATAQAAADHEQRRAREEEASALKAHLQLEEAERTLERLRAAQDLAQHRPSLVAGEPCPLCGSREHPAANDQAPPSSVVADQLLRVEELRAQERAHQALLTQHQTQEKAQRRLAQQVEQALPELERRRAALLVRWQEVATLLGDLPPAPPEDVAGALAAHHERAREGLREQQAQRQRLDQLGEVVRRAHAQLQRCHAARQEALTRLAGAQRAAELAEVEVRTTRERRAERLAELEALSPNLSPLASLDPDWRRRLGEDPALLREHLLQACKSWDEQLSQAEQARAHLAELETQLQAADQRLGALHSRLEEDERALTEQDGRLAALRADRAALLGGRPVEEARGELDTHLSTCQQRLEGARKELEGLGQRHAELAGQRAELERRAADLRERVAHTRDAWEQALREASLPEELALGHLSRPPSWLLEQRERQETQRKELERLQTLSDERLRALEHHRGAPPPLDPAAALDELAAVEQERRSWTERRDDVSARLRADEDLRRAYEELRPQVDQQRAVADLWRRLNALIGSNDGKKLRTFAQSLTLEALLGLANLHLRELTHRYELQRVPGTDMELQIIDHDLGDEVRTLNSLSGGESFLTSLALALGLSSLAARDVAVESLFIDEGFGTLDPAALEIALSVLDALQASGRQVGVISHVPGLAERIGVRVEVAPIGGGRSRVVTRLS